MDTEHAKVISLASKFEQIATTTKSIPHPGFHKETRSPKGRAWGWRDVVCLLTMALLVVAMVYRYVPHITHDVAGEWWDPLLNIWTMSWDTRTLLHDPLNLWQGQLLYPNSLTLSYSENLLGETIFYAPIFLLTHNPVLAYNLVFYLTFFLCGANMYILVRHLTGSPLASFVAGLIFAFSPYRIGQIDHIHIIAGQWMPLALLYLNFALEQNRWRHWILFALFYLLQILSSIYYGIFFSYALLTYTLIRYGKPLLARWRERRQHKSPEQQRWRVNLRALRPRRAFKSLRSYTKALIIYAKKPLTVLGAVGAFLVLLMFPYLLSMSSGLERGIDQSATFSAYVRDFLFTAPFNWLYGVSTYNGVSLPYDSEHYLFLGWFTLVVAVLGIALVMRGSNPMLRAYVWTAIILLLFSFGPFLQYSTASGAPYIPLPNVEAPVDPPGWSMPWFLAYFILPGFKGLRVPARLTGVLLLFIALLAAYGVAWLEGLLHTEDGKQREQKEHTFFAALLRSEAFTRARPLLIKVTLCVIPLVVVLEGVPAYLPVTHVPVGNQIPPVYRWLATHEGNQPIVELPMAHLDESFTTKDEAWYDYYAIYHPHPIMNGWSGYHPPLTVSIAESLMFFPENDSIETLREYGVYYVVLHLQLYPPAEAPYVIAAVRTNKDLQLAASFGSDSVWQVKQL